MSITVGDFIIERLHGWGVRKIFGYPGDEREGGVFKETVRQVFSALLPGDKERM